MARRKSQPNVASPTEVRFGLSVVEFAPARDRNSVAASRSAVAPTVVRQTRLVRPLVRVDVAQKLPNVAHATSTAGKSGSASIRLVA
jgi:hypothetical protein